MIKLLPAEGTEAVLYVLKGHSSSLDGFIMILLSLDASEHSLKSEEVQSGNHNIMSQTWPAAHSSFDSKGGVNIVNLKYMLPHAQCSNYFRI